MLMLALLKEWNPKTYTSSEILAHLNTQSDLIKDTIQVTKLNLNNVHKELVMCANELLIELVEDSVKTKTGKVYSNTIMSSKLNKMYEMLAANISHKDYISKE